MKLQKVWLPLVIVLLIAASIWVMVGTKYDAKQHARVAAFPVKYGLDIRGGIRTILRADVSKAPKGQYDQATVQHILERRINNAGVGEATVQPKGSDQFIVEIPDVKDKDAVLKQLGTTASMQFYHFKEVVCKRDANRPVRMTSSTDPITGHENYSFFDARHPQQGPFRDGLQIREDYSKILSEGAAARSGATLTTVTPPLTSQNVQLYLTADQQKRVVALNQEMTAWKDFLASCGPPILQGADILPKSVASLGGNSGVQPTVSQEFSPNGTRAFADFTRKNIDETMGIVLDDGVLSAPNIESPILDGHGQISGGFETLKEAKSLADMLNAGALPVPLEQVQTTSLEASLGHGAVEKDIHAGLIGLALVVLCMLFWYRLPGLVACVALLIYSLFTLAIFRGGLQWLGVPPVTLTLAGIAGFILSVGMAVDANILIFERMKEELRNGRGLRSAIDAGFQRAFPAIRDSNICTIITSVVLFSMGTPSVRGFALTLMIGVIVSLFSAITVTRTLLYALVEAGFGKNTKLFGVDQNAVVSTKPGYNIVGRRKLFYAISAAIIIPGLFFWLAVHPSGLKKSIEFKSGSQMQVAFDKPATQQEVTHALEAAGLQEPLVQMAEGGRQAIITTEEVTNNADASKNIDPVTNRDLVEVKITNALNTIRQTTRLYFDRVQPLISNELTSKAIQAVAFASLLIVLYLAFAFATGGFAAGLRMGVSAIAALLHDVVLLIGVFAILGHFLNWKIDSLFVTALLTVIGFSVHDTVVIFDRVRENLRKRQRGEPFENLVNVSILQTFHRSVRTSLTVLMTLGALIVFGGETTLLLNVALFIGILSGTYSSIFNAASILVDWENWLAKRGSGITNAPVAALAGAGAPAPSGPSRPTPSAPNVSIAAEDEDEAGRLRPKKKRPIRRF
ncbi:MAG: protein translocase subunit secF/protein translocase subunit secD [Capsulimonas sp.]|nr:protein translocase subunit secF/protein translocase subunit secD [Capsulimonas sp.]